MEILVICMLLCADRDQASDCAWEALKAISTLNEEVFNASEETHTCILLRAKEDVAAMSQQLAAQSIKVQELEASLAEATQLTGKRSYLSEGPVEELLVPFRGIS